VQYLAGLSSAEVSGSAGVGLDTSGGNVSSAVSLSFEEIEKFWDQFYDGHCDSVDAGVDTTSSNLVARMSFLFLILV
jgi:hypothetical protein